MSPLPIALGDGAMLRRYAMEDLEVIWAAVERERERLGVWMPWVEGAKTIDDERTWLEAVLADEKNLAGTGLFVDGAYAGGVGLMVDPFSVAGELGYWVVKEHEGRGLVTKACRR